MASKHLSDPIKEEKFSTENNPDFDVRSEALYRAVGLLESGEVKGVSPLKLARKLERYLRNG